MGSISKTTWLKISFQNSRHLNCDFVRNNRKRKFKKIKPKQKEQNKKQQTKQPIIVPMLQTNQHKLLFNKNLSSIKSWKKDKRSQVQWTLERKQSW